MQSSLSIESSKQGPSAAATSLGPAGDTSLEASYVLSNELPPGTPGSKTDGIDAVATGEAKAVVGEAKAVAGDQRAHTAAAAEATLVGEMGCLPKALALGVHPPACWLPADGIS